MAAGVLNKILKGEEKKPMARKAAKVKVAKTESAPAPRHAQPRKADPSVYQVLSHPRITEKATYLVQFNKYTFVVPVTVGKQEVAEKVLALYGLKPVKVNFVKVLGKVVKRGRKLGFRKDFKKAIITLKPGEKIDLYEGV